MSTQPIDRVFLNHAPRSVALVAMGPSVVDFISDTFTQELAPGWVDEVWGINMACQGILHDVCFWMDDLEAQRSFRPGLIDLMRERGKPVITTKRYPELVPLSYDYPAQEVVKLGWECFGRPYLNNGVVMAVAYALWKGVKHLKIYGADFTYPNRNYAETGRACIEAWIVFASSKGMAVSVSGSSSLFDAGLSNAGIYGYKEQPEMVIDGQRMKFIKGVRPELEQGYKPEDSSGQPPIVANGLDGAHA